MRTRNILALVSTLALAVPALGAQQSAAKAATTTQAKDSTKKGKAKSTKGKMGKMGKDSAKAKAAPKK